MNTLRLGKHLISTAVNGPGRRFVLWLQGCPLHCKGCINPEFWDETGGQRVPVETLLEHICATPNIEGVTFTGGEPMVQAGALLPLAQALQQQCLSVVCYTGYRYEDILNDKIPAAKALLPWIDILIDGPYEEAQKAPLLWRGSCNQRVLFLTERYQHLEPLAAMADHREVELQVNDAGVNMTGIFDMALWRRLKEKLDR
jgi:anaerobic ribonucleoside-triphosphate reductase activating protein